MSALWMTVFFAMLWLPLGQHDFLVPHWMKLGTFMAPLMLMMHYQDREGSGASDIRGVSVWMLVLYIAHQFEEHWIDLLGNHCAFYPSVNQLLAAVLEPGSNGSEWLSPLSIFVINTSLVWLVGLTAIVFCRVSLFPVLAMNSIILVNGLTHMIAALAQRDYNPGLATAALLFIPFSGWVFLSVLRLHFATVSTLVLALLWAVLAHILMVGGLVATNRYGLLSESAYHVSLVLWSLIPLAWMKVKRNR